MTSSISSDAQHIGKLKEVEQLIASNDLQRAALALNQLATTSPRDPRLYLLASHLAQASGNTDGVLEAAKKANQLAPTWPIATIHLAGVLAKLGAAEEAMNFAANAIAQAKLQSTLSLELLHHAASIAHALSWTDHALSWLNEAGKISPSDVSTRYRIALVHTLRKEFDEAIGVLSVLLDQRPNDVALLTARLRAFLGAKDNGQALLDADALVATDPRNEEYLFYQTIARGQTPAAQPPAMIAAMFDDMAGRFERMSIIGLKYKLPRDAAKMIVNWYPERCFDMLELGSGTGLLGACLGEIDGVLVGVDLSRGMIEQASRHNVYHKFHHVNLLDALKATPDGLYDVIAALDVFPYVGALDKALADAYRILNVGGRMIFSCESGSQQEGDAMFDQGYSLQRTFRYVHERSYVEQLLLSAGFTNISCEEIELSVQGDQSIKGFLVSAQKTLNGLAQQADPKPEKIGRRSPKSAKPPRRS